MILEVWNLIKSVQISYGSDPECNHPEVHYLPICGSVMLENKVTVPEIKWWNSPAQ